MSGSDDADRVGRDGSDPEDGDAFVPGQFHDLAGAARSIRRQAIPNRDQYVAELQDAQTDIGVRAIALWRGRWQAGQFFDHRRLAEKIVKLGSGLSRFEILLIDRAREWK